MNKEIYSVTGATDNTKVFEGYKVTSGTRMVVNSGIIIVDLITCFGDSNVLSATYD